MAVQIDRLLQLVEEAGTSANWNLKECYGNYITGKAQAFLIKLAECDGLFYTKSEALGLAKHERIHSNLIIAGPAAAGFMNFLIRETDYTVNTPTAIALQVPLLERIGSVRRWQVFCHMDFPTDKILLTRWTKEEGLCKMGLRIVLNNLS